MIGKILLVVWLALTPTEQTSRMNVMAEEYCQQQQCFEVLVTAVQEGENVIFLAICNKYFL